MKSTLAAIALVFLCEIGFAEECRLPGTKVLKMKGEISAQMVSGISKFLDAETDRSMKTRENYWHYDLTSEKSYEASTEANRERFRKRIGAVDPRLDVRELELIAGSETSATVAETKEFTVFAVRWAVFENVYGEGLWIKPKGPLLAQVVAIPDADQTPEMLMGLAPGIKEESQFARRLAENGCEILIPTLVNRADTWSGNSKINRLTNQPHREWIYRQAYEMGRHIIGYEVQKVLAAVDFFQSETGGKGSVGVAGYGEGGLLAMYSAALSQKIDATLVSGYFGSRQRVWEEPIYRNVFGLLEEFGDAEVASLIVPRGLTVEFSPTPSVSGPPIPHDGRTGAAPGRIATPTFQSTSNEFDRLNKLVRVSRLAKKPRFISGEGITVSPGSEKALLTFVEQLGVPLKQLTRSSELVVNARKNFSPEERQRRQVAELVEHTQCVYRDSERRRNELVWSKLKYDSLTNFETSAKPLRDYFRDEVIGRFTNAFLPTNPRTQKISETDKWTAYDVVLDVYPDVIAWGQMLVPKDIKPDEHRAVVVCQHGLEGLPQDVITTNAADEVFKYYQGFGARLADRGFVVFAPHNPYRGGDRFRQLQRKANPLKKTLFSIISAQHEQILNWLSTLPFVDASHIGFYGLSYGGKSAMRLPALLDRYALSICSGDFNDWIQKNVSVDFPGSYMFSGEYEMAEFNLGNTFNYAEIAALIAPRLFMVERGHHDGVGVDSWVAAEYIKVQKLYDELAIKDRTKIEFFNGPHRINGVETFPFLDRLK